jgi:hypothetical protein
VSPTFLADGLKAIKIRFFKTLTIIFFKTTLEVC